jgi:cysteine synthase A
LPAAADGRVFLTRPFENCYNAEAHARTTGPELVAQLASVGRPPPAFVAGVGTGGTVMGTGHYLRQHFLGVKIHPLEPAKSPTLTTGHKVGSYRIQSISDEFIPAIVQLAELDAVMQASDSDAILVAQKLAQQLRLDHCLSRLAVPYAHAEARDAAKRLAVRAR